MLENTGSITKDNKKIIIPRHINLFIKDDEEIDELLSDVTIPSVGVRPYIHKALFQPRYKDKNKSIVSVTRAIFWARPFTGSPPRFPLIWYF